MAEQDSDIHLPDYVTCEFLQDILRKEENCQNIKVLKFVPSAGSALGDNFVAIVVRVRVDAIKHGEPTSYSLMMKTMPRNVFRMEMTGTVDLFDIEIEMYMKVIPELVQHQKEKGVEDVFCAIPRCLYALTDKRESIIILKDLKPLGYEMGNKKLGLGYEQCRLVMRALGQLHSLSLAMKLDDREKFDLCKQNIKENMFKEAKREMFEAYLKGSVINIANVLKETGSDANLVTRFEKFGDDIFKDTLKLLEPREPTAVINHGDCWFNNMLFKYDPENKKHPISVKLLDLQISRYGSPVLDLSYFLYSSTTQDVRQQHLEELLRLYHGTVVDSLRSMGSDPNIFTYEVFKKEWRDYASFGLVSAMMVLPIILANKEDVPDFEKFEESQMKEDKMIEQWRKLLNKDFADRMRGVVSDFVQDSII